MLYFIDMLRHFRDFRHFRGRITLDRALIVLAVIAVVLATAAYFEVFYGGGTYVLSSPLPTSTVAMGATTTGAGAASSTPDLNASSSTDSAGGSLNGGGTTDGTGTPLASYSSAYATPPVSWTEGYDTLSITGATLSGSQLTLDINVQMGAVAECVPLNLSLVTDEMGDLQGPLNAAFTFGENGTCIGAPGASYPGQQVIFNVNPSFMPLSFTTGGSSHTYFELSTTPSGGIDISLPPTRG